MAPARQSSRRLMRGLHSRSGGARRAVCVAVDDGGAQCPVWGPSAWATSGRRATDCSLTETWERRGTICAAPRTSSRPGTCVKCGEGGTRRCSSAATCSTDAVTAAPMAGRPDGSRTGTSTLNSLARKHAAGKEYVLTDRRRAAFLAHPRGEGYQRARGGVDSWRAIRLTEWERLQLELYYTRSFRVYKTHPAADPCVSAGYLTRAPG